MPHLRTEAGHWRHYTDLAHALREAMPGDQIELDSVSPVITIGAIGPSKLNMRTPEQLSEMANHEAERSNLQALALHLFHRLWSLAKDRTGPDVEIPYHDEKRLWMALQTVLLKLGVNV